MHATKFVDNYFDSWNCDDPQRGANPLACDGIYVDMPENIQRTHDELIDSQNDFFSEFATRYELIGDIFRWPQFEFYIPCGVREARRHVAGAVAESRRGKFASVRRQ